jgi:hypothetical protein
VVLRHLYEVNGSNILEGTFKHYDVPEQGRNLIQNGVLFNWNAHDDKVVIKKDISWEAFDINDRSDKLDEFSFLVNPL